jgi:hypothetical protein
LCKPSICDCYQARFAINNKTSQTKPLRKLEQEIREILKGIDQEETKEHGWWETSSGAKFGAKVLENVLAKVRGQ